MSLFGALNTAISGLDAQSAAFGNIGDNVANSQTIGFKQVDTRFVDYLTQSTATENDPGSVLALPTYLNNVQGTITQSSNPLALAIAGGGFFAVSQPTGTGSNGATTFDPRTEYSRAGDFTMNREGYLVNGSGQYLNGWTVDPGGAVNRNGLAPIQISQAATAPVPTTQLTLSANLPATPASAAPVSSQVQVYDARGTPHTVELDWTRTATDEWTVAVKVPDSAGGAARGTAAVQFGAASGNPVPAGTVGGVGAATGTVTAGSYAAGQPATLSFSADFGAGAQSVTLNLGTYGQSSGLTQYAGTDYSLRGLSGNGVPPGSFSSVSTKANGDVVVNYDNGQSRTVARVPLVTFADPNALQRENGQAFTTTETSGAPLAQDAGANGAGTLVTGSTESSNVDIATEFTKLIVAQRAYSANTKMVTTADDMLQQTLDMKR